MSKKIIDKQTLGLNLVVSKNNLTEITEKEKDKFIDNLATFMSERGFMMGGGIKYNEYEV